MAQMLRESSRISGIIVEWLLAEEFSKKRRIGTNFGQFSEKLEKLLIGSKTNGFPVIYEPISDEGIRAMKCRMKISILVVAQSEFLIGATRLFAKNFNKGKLQGKVSNSIHFV